MDTQSFAWQQLHAAAAHSGFNDDAQQLGFGKIDSNMLPEQSLTDARANSSTPGSDDPNTDNLGDSQSKRLTKRSEP
jgi:hypothetical protein